MKYAILLLLSGCTFVPYLPPITDKVASNDLAECKTESMKFEVASQDPGLGQLLASNEFKQCLRNRGYK